MPRTFTFTPADKDQVFTIIVVRDEQTVVNVSDGNTKLQLSISTTRGGSPIIQIPSTKGKFDLRPSLLESLDEGMTYQHNIWDYSSSTDGKRIATGTFTHAESIKSVDIAYPTVTLPDGTLRVFVTQAEYDSIDPKDPNAEYIVDGAVPVTGAVITLVAAPTIAALVAGDTLAAKTTQGSAIVDKGGITTETTWKDDAGNSVAGDFVLTEGLIVIAIDTHTASTGGAVLVSESEPCTVTVAVSSGEAIPATISTLAELRAIINGTTSVSDGDVIALAPGTYDTQSIPGTEFTTDLGAVTIRSADPSNKAVLNRWYFRGDTTGLTLAHLYFQRYQLPRTGWWSPNPITLEGPFYYYSGHNTDGFITEGCIFDGGLEPGHSGGNLTTNNSVSLDGVKNAIFRRNVARRTFTGIYLDGCQDCLVEDNLFEKLHADGIALSNASGNCEGNIVQNNHVQDFVGKVYHMDTLQVQPSPNGFWVRNNRIVGNTSSPGLGPHFAQADPLIASTVWSHAEVDTTAGAKALTISAFGPGSVFYKSAGSNPLTISAGAATINGSTDPVTIPTGSTVVFKYLGNSAYETAVYAGQTLSQVIDLLEIAQEIRISPDDSVQDMVINLPSAAASLGKQFCFRQTGSTGSASFVLDGADTWAGGASPQVAAPGEYVSFVSDGTSEWKELTPGFSVRYLLASASRTLGARENGHVVIVDAAAGDVDITLPAGSSYKYTIRREDASANTVRVVRDTGDTLSIRGADVASISFVMGYCLQITGAAGAYSVIEAGINNQGIFGNRHQNGLYEDNVMEGNILAKLAGVGFKLEQDVPGIRVNNNMFIPMLFDDMNGDGVISRYEIGPEVVGSIDMRGETARSFNNFTTGQLILSAGTASAADVGTIALGLTTTVGAEGALSDYLVGSTRADYRPVSRDEVVAMAKALVAGPLDGTFKGPSGTTETDGFYNFHAGMVNTAILPAPVISNVTPTAGGTLGLDGVVDITYDQFVALGAGIITLRNVTDGVDIETFNSATGVGSGGGTVTALKRAVTIDPGADTVAGKTYSIRMDVGAVVGHYDKPSAAITTDTVVFWGAASIPTAYDTVSFAGANLSRTAKFDGMVGDKKKILFGFNGYRASTSDALGKLIDCNGVTDFAVSVTASGEIRCSIGTSNFRVPAAVPTAGPAETVLMSIDTAAASIADGVKIYRNGVLIDTSAFTQVTWNPDTSYGADATYAVTIFNNDNLAGSQFNGQAGFIYMEAPVTLPDMSDAAIRAKFAPGSLLPSDGASPTGAAPAVFFTGSGFQSETNLGYGGAFTRTGTFTTV